MRNAGLAEAQAGSKTARRNINNLRYADNNSLMAERKETLKSLLMRVKKSEKAGLKFNIKKLRSWHLAPSFHGKEKGGEWKQWQILFYWAPKSLQLVIATMKLKDAYSLEEKLWQTCMLGNLSCVLLFTTPRTVDLKAPLSMGFSRQEY